MSQKEKGDKKCIVFRRLERPKRLRFRAFCCSVVIVEVDATAFPHSDLCRCYSDNIKRSFECVY